MIMELDERDNVGPMGSFALPAVGYTDLICLIQGALDLHFKAVLIKHGSIQN